MESLILEELKDKEVNIEHITKYIISLPFKLKSQKPDIDCLFKYLNATIWNFIDYTLLECIIHQFGSAQLQREMENYVTDITNFSRQTTVSQFSAYWPGRMDTPTRYSELTARINTDPDVRTIEQLILLKKDLCKQFLPPHSEFAMMFCNCTCTSDSIELKWLIAIDLVVTLMTEIYRPVNSSFFAKNFIESLQVRYVVVYPDPNLGMSLI